MNNQNQSKEEAILNELQYLIKEGFVVYNEQDDTYRLREDYEIKQEIETV